MVCPCALTDTPTDGPAMPPKVRVRPAAAAQRRPKVRVKRREYNERSLARRAAIALLNGLAESVGVRKVPKKSAASTVEALVRRLEPRCQADGLPERLREAVERFLQNGGTLTAAVLPPEEHGGADEGAPPPVSRHRLLEPGFRIKSKAFMMTFNNKEFSDETWPAFLAWTKRRRQELGARRWAACWEESENATAAGGRKVFHFHAYLWWTDGTGARREFE